MTITSTESMELLSDWSPKLRLDVHPVFSCLPPPASGHRKVMLVTVYTLCSANDSLLETIWIHRTVHYLGASVLV